MDEWWCLDIVAGSHLLWSDLLDIECRIRSGVSKGVIIMRGFFGQHGSGQILQAVYKADTVGKKTLTVFLVFCTGSCYIHYT